MSHPGASKDRHIEVCLRERMEPDDPGQANGFARWRLVGKVPDFAFAEIDTSCEFLGRKLSLPLLVSSLTGGGARSGELNRRLAEAAQATGIGMVVGSQRIMLKHPQTADTFQVRRWAPDILLLADLGLVHLNCGLTEVDCRRAVEAIGADGLVLYVSPLHELFQTEGSTDFRGLFDKLAKLRQTFPYPLLVKEVGFGLSEPTLKRLAKLELDAVDVAGQGGTDWGRVESALGGRGASAVYRELGLPTAEAVEAAVRVLPASTAVVASGGVRTGVEIAKALALGARCAGMGLPFLRWASESAERVADGVRRVEEELRVSLWHAGAKDLASLRGRVARC